MTEVQPYKVVHEYRGFEVRDYPAHSLVTMSMTGDLARAGNSAFGYLASYIGGANRARQNIEMTAPVIERPIFAGPSNPKAGQSVTKVRSQDETVGYQVSFVMPANLGASSPPDPLRPELKVERNPGGVFAAIRFSGVASQDLFFRKAEKLLELLRSEELVPKGQPIFARFNGPWTPGPLRRNEVLFEIESPRLQP